MSAEPRTGDRHHDAVLGAVTVQDVRDGHVYLTALRDGYDPHVSTCTAPRHAPDTETAAVPDSGMSLIVWLALAGS